MNSLYPYKPETLGEMFSLRTGDINSLILSEGIPYYSINENNFLGYLPSLQSAFVLNKELLPFCLKNIKPHNYRIFLKESLIQISSKEITIPATSFLYKNLWVKKASQLLDIDKNFSILISEREKVPFYCGHSKFITRLAENFTGKINVVNATNFIKKWQEDNNE